MTAGNDNGIKRAEIMQAAERLFTSRRFHEITLDEVAREAGVGKGTIYRCFQDKDDLFFQTATRGFDELCELMEREVHPDAPFPEQLLGVCRQIGQFFEHRHRLLRMMQAEEGRALWSRGTIREKWLARRAKLAAAVAGILAKGVAEAQIRPDLPPDVLAGYLLGMLRTRAHDLTEAEPGYQSMEWVVELFCRGAGCPPRASGGVLPAGAVVAPRNGT